jgi:8-oxo-dGTP diphosphatase
MDVTDSRPGQHRHIDLVYVCRATNGTLTAQLEEVGGAQWVAVADIPGLSTPTELPDLVAAATRWAKAQP